MTAHPGKPVTGAYHGPVSACVPSHPNRRAVDGDLGWDLGIVFRAHAKAARAALGDVPGGPRGFQVLVAACAEQHGSQAAIARTLGIDRTVMTYLLDDLETADLVRRIPDPNDRRARRLTVTPAGHQLLAELERRMAALEAELLVGLPDGERTALLAGLRRMAARLEAIDPVHDRCDLAEAVDP